MSRPTNTSTLIPAHQVPDEVMRYVQLGECFDFVNDTGTVIPAGAPVGRGNLWGFTRRPIPCNGDGAAFMPHAHIYEMASAVDFQIGDPVFVDLANRTAHAGPADNANGIFFVGHAIPRWGQPGADDNAGLYEDMAACNTAGGDECVRVVQALPNSVQSVPTDVPNYPVLFPLGPYPHDTTGVNPKP